MTISPRGTLLDELHTLGIPDGDHGKPFNAFSCNDTIFSGVGNDILVNGLGDDALKGGTGSDCFRSTSISFA